MSIRTGELPQASSVTAKNSMLVNTDNGTEQLEFGKASQFFQEALKPAMRAEAAAAGTEVQTDLKAGASGLPIARRTRSTPERPRSYLTPPGRIWTMLSTSR